MLSFKSKILIVLFLVISLFPVYKIVRAQTEGDEPSTEMSEKVNPESESGGERQGSSEVESSSESEPSGEPASEPTTEPSSEPASELIDTGETDKSIPEPETTQEEQKEESGNPDDVKKALEEVKAGVPKNSTLSNIVVIAEHVIAKTYKDKDELKLGNIANKFFSGGAPKSELEKELNKIVIKKPRVKKLTTSKGFRIKCIILINKQPLYACIEVGKKETKEWYGVFYVKSPKNWKLTEYFPELLSLNKLFPNIDKALLDKYANIDALEFADSYFYISTMANDEYKKFGKILKGMGFSGKVKIDSIFGIKGFDAKDCSADISWDFESKNILPKSVNIAGKLQSGKSKLELALGLSKNSDNKFDLKVTSTGDLYTKDFAEFWLDTILADQIKNKTIDKEKMLKIVPEAVLEKVTFDVNWPAKEGDAESEKRKINLTVKNTDIKLGEFVAGLLPTSALSLKDELNKVAVKKMSAKYYKGGFRISSKIDINKKLVKSVLEVAKEPANEDGKWYSLFYIKSPDIKPTPAETKEDEPIDGETLGAKPVEIKLPETWKISEFFPDIKLFPNIKSSNLDLLEFKDSFFYISTIDMTVSDKIGKVVKGVGFKGKARFIGELKFIDEIFSTIATGTATSTDTGKFFDVSGNISTSLANSDFSIKLPAVNIISEALKIPGMPEIKLIPGFKVDLADQNFKLKFKDKKPEFSGSGLVTVKLPYEDNRITFSSSIGFADNELKLFGEQKIKMDSLFGIKDFTAEKCKVDIAWDFGTKNILPKDLNIKGKISSGNSNLNLDLNFSSEDKNKVDLLVTATGDLFVKDFAKFWLNVIIKNPEITKKVMPVIPDFKFEDVVFTGKWAEEEKDRKLSLKVKKADVPLGEFVRILMDQKEGGAKGEAQKTLASYLDAYKITKAGAAYYNGGLRVKSTVNVNNKPVESVLEIAKEDGKKDGSWYVLYYIKSPDIKSTAAETKEDESIDGDVQTPVVKKTETVSQPTWKVSEFFPDLVTVKKLFPQLEWAKLEKGLQQNKDIWALVSNPDVFEFSESFFYISTLAMKKHEKIGSIVQGAGFKTKAKFIGLLDILNKIFVLDKPLELSGVITPKLVGSKFSMTIPTNVTIFPESITVNNKKQDLIKGFHVDLAPSTFAIKITEDIPAVEVEGAVAVTLPPQILKEKLVLSSGMKFSGTAFTLTAEQKTPLKDVFGIKNLDLDAGKIGLTWDLAVSSQWAEVAAAATAAIGGIGAAAVVLPVGFVIKGGLSSGITADKKSSLNLEADFKFDPVKLVDVVYTSSGTLYAQDFAKFWVNVLDKTSSQQAKDAFLSKVPPFIFKDVVINAAWSKEEEKKFDLSIGHFELIPGQSASMALKVSADGISGSGSVSPVYFPDKNNPVITLTKSLANKTEGPSFSIDCKVNPTKLALTANAGLILKSLIPGLKDVPGFKDIESETKIDVSDSGGIELVSSIKLLDYLSTLTIIGKIENPININSWAIVAGFDQVSTGSMSKSFKDVSVELLKSYNDKVAENKEFIKKNCTEAQQANIKKIKEKKETVQNEISNFFNNSRNVLAREEERLWKEVQEWTSACNGKPAVEKEICWTAQVPWRSVELEAVKACRNVSHIIEAAIQLGVTYVSKAEQFFAALSPTNIASNFELLSKTIEELAQKTFKEFDSLITNIGKKLFSIRSLRIEASVAKIKDGKLPSIEYQVVVADKLYDKRKLELDLKNPGDFIKTIAQDAIKNAIGDVADKISDVTKTANEKLEAVNTKIAKETEEAERKSRDLKK